MLGRCLRRGFLASDGGPLQEDLATAVVEATTEVMGSHADTPVNLNGLFELRLKEPHLVLPIEDVEHAVSEVATTIIFEHDIFDLLRNAATNHAHVISSSCGTATMMSDSGISVFEYTIDDGVYFFTYAEPDVCEMEWWFAHSVADVVSRAQAIENAKSMIGFYDDLEEY
jgi:hypothetical protein